jgi:protein-disulfide isomerase
VRKQLAAERRRRRIFWGVATVCLLIVASLTVWVVARGGRGAVNIPASANKDGNAIVTGSGPVTVEDYIDFMCPHCKAFHDDAGQAINQLAQQNKITFVQHPVAYLDAASTTRYSTRSSAASGCASDGGRFTEYADILFANQPAEGGSGLTDDQLISLGTQVGLGDSFSHCVKDGRYLTWAKKVSDDATRAGITGTPTVFVNGKKVQATAAAVLAAVAAAGPAPTPSGR